MKIIIELEYMKNGDLFSYLTKNGNINEEKMKNFSFDIFSALKYLHSKNIIHRDIKLENLFVVVDNYREYVKLGDLVYLIPEELYSHLL